MSFSCKVIVFYTDKKTYDAQGEGNRGMVAWGQDGEMSEDSQYADVVGWRIDLKSSYLITL